MKAKYNKNNTFEDRCGCIFKVYSAPKKGKFYIIETLYTGGSYKFKWERKDFEKNAKKMERLS